MKLGIISLSAALILAIVFVIVYIKKYKHDVIGFVLDAWEMLGVFFALILLGVTLIKGV